MLDRLLTPEEVQSLQGDIARLKEQRASLVEDLQAGMPVQPQIDAIDGGVRTAEHMIRKYGKAPAVAPRRRK
jgi:hypothetical protein